MPTDDTKCCLRLSISIYGFTALVSLGRLSFLIYTKLLGFIGRGISPSQGNYQHRTTQTDIHASSGIRNHDTQCSSVRRRYALDRAATVIVT
jgi:hypothetical protein